MAERERERGPSITIARAIAQPVLTPPLAMGRTLERSTSGLLGEAFRLHRLAPKPAYVTKSDWPISDPTTLAIDLGELRLSLHDALFGATQKVTKVVMGHIGGVLAAAGHVVVDVLTNERARAALREQI